MTSDKPLDHWATTIADWSAAHATGWYVGVTHEYLDVASAGIIDGAEFVDHADGANRPDKFSRDIALLEEALKTETRPGMIERYTSIWRSRISTPAIGPRPRNTTKRVQLGGFDEEVWYAQLHLAQCLGNMGDEPKFVWSMLQAYQMRPHRAEALYDLARTFANEATTISVCCFPTSACEWPIPSTTYCSLTIRSSTLV